MQNQFGHSVRDVGIWYFYIHYMWRVPSTYCNENVTDGGTCQNGTDSIELNLKYRPDLAVKNTRFSSMFTTLYIIIQKYKGLFSFQK